ncbi:MAG: hypothetical protein CME67_05725 [Halobacteriovoraceae bacterium]|nr:hypothetical protein [Peredibacter sp.]MBJ00713.1 hypothetical protein [Halobacteriovoraceae bacterium]|tara:strand:- start:13568 stop:14464 length:897 start_codon:yes stop_codon:yes gene_type:complete
MKNTIKLLKSASVCILLASFSSNAQEIEDSFSTGIEFESYNDVYRNRTVFGRKNDRNRFKAKVKVYENGDYELENIEWSSGTLFDRYEKFGIDLEVDVLGAYRDVIQREVGREVGLKMAGLRARKELEIEAVDGLTLTIEGAVNLKRIWSLRAYKENSFVADRVDEESENEPFKFYQDGYGLDYETSAKINYEYKNMDFSFAGYAKMRDTRESNHSDGHNFKYDTKELGAKFSWTPNKNKCHMIELGARSSNVNQVFNHTAHDFTNSEVFVQYKCKYNIDRDHWGFEKTKSRDSYIRY